MQIDVEIVTGGVRSDDDFVDQRADATHRLSLRLLIREAFNQLANSGPITFAHARLDQLRFCIRRSQFSLNGVALGDGGVQIALHLASVNRPCANGLDQLVTLGDHLGEVLFQSAPIGAPLFLHRRQAPLVFPGEQIKERRIKKIIAQSKEDDVF